MRLFLKPGLLVMFLSIAGLWSLGSRYLASEPTLTTSTQSSQFATLAEALQFLASYLDLPSAVEDVAYEIFYQDNSQGLPGPSDWDIKVVVKVLPEHINEWLKGFGQAEPFELSWGYAMADTRGITLTSEPFFYARSGERIAVFPQGVIFYWHSTLIN